MMLLFLLLFLQYKIQADDEPTYPKQIGAKVKALS